MTNATAAWRIPAAWSPIGQGLPDQIFGDGLPTWIFGDLVPN